MLEKQIKKVCKMYEVEYSNDILEYIKCNLKHNNNLEVLLVCYLNKIKLCV